MKLSNFENSINSTILMRGKDYYDNNYVESLEEVSEGEWQARVEGTELYQIDVVLSDDNKIVDHYCECPYDGTYCKHEVAVFYTLKAMHSKQKGKRPKRMTIKKKIELIFEKLSEGELKDYLQKSVLNNKKQRDHFLIIFDHLLGEGADPVKYQKMVQGIINNYSTHGFIDYRASYGVCRELDTLLDQARDSLQHNAELAFIISCAVIEAIPGMAEEMDDSNGESSGVLYEALEIIFQYLQQADAEKLEVAFHWCMKTYLNNGYSDYGYDEVDRLFHYFCTANSIYKAQLLKVLDKKIARANEYERTRCLFDKMDLCRMWGDKSVSRKITLDNIKEPEFRQILVDESLDDNKPDEAIKLIKEGIILAEQRHHSGVVSNWQNKLLKIAQQQNNEDEIACIAKLLLLNSFSMDYYRLFKAASKNWEKDYPELIKKMEGQEENIAQIYAEENDVEALFSLIKRETVKHSGFGRYFSGLYLLKAYIDVLADDYPSEILDLYSEDIYRHAKQTGRNVYEDIARDLKDMQKLEGGEERVRKIVANFQEKYKNRPAMQEILGKL